MGYEDTGIILLVIEIVAGVLYILFFPRQ